MKNRRKFLKSAGAAASLIAIPAYRESKVKKTDFKYCLNTSTISGQNPGILGYIEIAAEAGYDGIELWIRDIDDFVKNGKSLSQLKSHLDEYGISVESAIGFAPWMASDREKSADGFVQMRKEMEMIAYLGGRRIAAPAAGVSGPIDLFYAGEKYHELLDLGRQTGVTPQLEFWGSSEFFYHIGQAMMVCAISNDPGARILTDVYHMYRGGSGFETLNYLSGHMIEVFHMNDYPAGIPRGKQTDADRVFPGDGEAPIREIISILNKMGGTKVLSLELFNRDYWKRDALSVASTGLQKMKSLVKESIKN